jgi:benzoyl-CoA 2,3-dioxygenase component B
MFTFFTDRDGKMQLEALAQSGFEPLSRTCRFMLTEEAHHMFVGETGVGRIVERTCTAMKENGIDDPTDIDAVRKLGVIDLPTIQKKLNLHFSLTLDLFGNEISTNAANAFHAGLKGRYREERLDDDHQLESGTYPVLRLVDNKVLNEDVPALSALNMRLRDDYVGDCQAGVTRWNRSIEKSGIDYRLKLPHVAFHRHIGEFSRINADTDGNILSPAEWTGRRTEMLPSAADKEFIEGLMKPQYERGKFASWIAPPKLGIDNKPGDFEYVKVPS